MVMAVHSSPISTPLYLSLNPFPNPLFTANPFLHFPRHLQTHLPLTASASHSPAVNADYLTTEFGGHGVTFEGIGDDCAVKMVLENGSKATMMLPSGLITSYKPRMWHGSSVEVLHTFVAEGEEGEAVVLGGVCPDFRFGDGNSRGFRPVPAAGWALRGVNGGPEEGVQVELISVDPVNNIEVKYVVTLKQELLGSELMITNSNSSSIEFLGLVSSHLKVSTPDATYAFGLQGANYVGTKPLQTGFTIIPPDKEMDRSSSGKQSWGQEVLQGISSGLSRRSGKDERNLDEVRNEGEIEGEEEENCTSMTKTFNRLYSCAPREFTVLDRGRRNSIIIERRGFDEFYISSPGSEHEWYGKYAYVCVGPSAMLVPVKLGPQQIWYGGQYLHNPNL